MPGLDQFERATYHIGRWPHEGVDFTGLRVGVRGRRAHALPGVQLLVSGRERPRQAARLMPYLASPPYVEKCSEAAATGYEGFAVG